LQAFDSRQHDGYVFVTRPCNLGTIFVTLEGGRRD